LRLADQLRLGVNTISVVSAIRGQIPAALQFLSSNLLRCIKLHNLHNALGTLTAYVIKL
jgi:hypothetical protein